MSFGVFYFMHEVNRLMEEQKRNNSPTNSSISTDRYDSLSILSFVEQAIKELILVKVSLYIDYM